MWVRRRVCGVGVPAFARRVAPRRAGTGLGEGCPTAVAGTAVCERSSASGPVRRILSAPYAAAGEIRRKHPVLVSSCDSNPGRFRVRPDGRRRIFAGPGPRRSAHTLDRQRAVAGRRADRRGPGQARRRHLAVLRELSRLRQAQLLAGHAGRGHSPSKSQFIRGLRPVSIGDINGVPVGHDPVAPALITPGAPPARATPTG
jgi:hypothetical protein